MNEESSIDIFLQELTSLCDKHNVQFGDDNYITIQLDGREVFNGTLGHDKPYKITDKGLEQLCKLGPLETVEIEAS